MWLGDHDAFVNVGSRMLSKKQMRIAYKGKNKLPRFFLPVCIKKRRFWSLTLLHLAKMIVTFLSSKKRFCSYPWIAIIIHVRVNNILKISIYFNFYRWAAGDGGRYSLQYECVQVCFEIMNVPKSAGLSWF